MDGVCRWMAWLYPRLLYLYPRAVRERFGAEMAWVFARGVEDAAAQGWRWLFGLLVREMRDLPGALCRVWIRECQRKGWNVSELSAGSSRSRDQERVRWAPRLSQAVVVQLYTQAAQGVIDEVLIDRIGAALDARAESMLLVSRRQIRCPRCEVVFGLGDVCRDEDLVRCPEPGCGWETTYQACRNSWRRRHLFGGSLLPTLEVYRAEYAETQSPEAKLQLIDRLLHAFGRDLRTGEIRWPSAGHFVEGKSPKAVALLESLTYGQASMPGLGETKRQWLEMLHSKRAAVSGEEVRGEL